MHRKLAFILAMGTLGFALLPSPNRMVAGATVSVTAIRGQLRLLFAAWDLNDDGYLDKAELAKALRGPHAKPYDYKKAAAKDKQDAKDDAENNAAEKNQDGPKDKKTTKPKTKLKYKSYPDYLLLVQLDENGDGKISRKEWETWAKGYASDLKAWLKAQERVDKAQAKYSNATTASAQRRALTSLQRYQRELLALEKQQKAYEKALLKAMNARSKR